MQGASPLASPGLNPDGTGFSFGRRCPKGACPRGCRLALLCRCPRGGLSFASPAAPALSLLSCPHPPDPLPGGKGEFQSLFCRGLRPRHPCDRVGSGTGFSFGRRCRKGASPLASPGAEPGRHWLFLWKAVPERGLSPGLPAGSAVPVPEGGACLLCRLPPLPRAYFPAPIPPTPFPSGEGGDFRLFYARGFAPCIPGS